MTSSNLRLRKTVAEMNYATHGFHRYYGKLPSEVYRHIFCNENSFTEFMCGSGTGLVEGLLAGKSVIGIDSNPLAVLLSKVKTTPIDASELRQMLRQIINNYSEYAIPLRDQITLGSYHSLKEIYKQFSKNDNSLNILSNAQETIANFDHWFSDLTAIELAILKSIIDEIKCDETKRFFLVCFSSIIRRVSNASPRTGKLFHIGQENDTPVLKAFEKKTKENIRGMEQFNDILPKGQHCIVLQEDVRSTSLKSESQELVICHPPYFAIYRYSAIFRFELGWLGFDRTRAKTMEIEEGFKTTDIGKYDKYINDMTRVIEEVNRILVKGGRFCLVVGDSSLRDTQLNVVRDLRKKVESSKFSFVRKIKRIIEGSQANYHPSSIKRVKRNNDFLIFFEKTGNM